MLKQMENNMNNRPYTDLRDNADDELAFVVENTEELYNLRRNPRALMAVLADDYKFTWWQVTTLIDNLNLQNLENME
tara:strand:+ start:76 stop:306 length:231 start_codon:yes stop_codon:yes gene_type:complete